MRVSAEVRVFIYLRLQAWSETVKLGVHDRFNNTKCEPQNSPCVVFEMQQSYTETKPAFYQGCADTLYAARVLPIL